MTGKIPGNRPDFKALQKTFRETKFRHSVASAAERIKRDRIRETAQTVVDGVNRHRMRERAQEVLDGSRPLRHRPDHLEMPEICHAWEQNHELNPFLENLGGNFQF